MRKAEVYGTRERPAMSVELAVGALAFVAALVPHRLDVVWKGQNVAVVVIAILLVLSWPRLRYSLDDLLGPVLLFSIIFLESLVFAATASPGFEVRVLLKEARDPLLCIGAGVWAAGIARYVDSRRSVRTLSLVVVVGALVYLGLHFTPFAPIVTRFENLAEAKGAMAGFESPNSLGATVAMLLPFLAVSAVTAPHWRWGGSGALLTFCAATVVLAATRSRGALLAGAAGLTLTFALGWIWVPAARRRMGAIVVLLLVASIGAGVLLQNTVIGSISKLQWSRLDRERTTSERVEMLKAGAGILALHPVLGTGLGGYAIHAPAALPFLTVEADTPHNEVLFVGAQAGLVGLLLLGGLYVWFFRRAWGVFSLVDPAWGVASVGFVATWLLVAVFFPYTFTPDVGVLAWTVVGLLGWRPRTGVTA